MTVRGFRQRRAQMGGNRRSRLNPSKQIEQSDRRQGDGAPETTCTADPHSETLQAVHEPEDRMKYQDLCIGSLPREMKIARFGVLDHRPMLRTRGCIPYAKHHTEDFSYVRLLGIEALGPRWVVDVKGSPEMCREVTAAS
jgi:hypothetical protein